MADLKRELDDLKEALEELVEEKSSLEADLKVTNERILEVRGNLKEGGYPTKLTEVEKLLEKEKKEFELEMCSIRETLSRLQEDD